MAIVVRVVGDTEKWTCVNRFSHITFGTRDASVKPKESNDLLARWDEVGADDSGIHELLFEDKPTFKGVVRAVLSR